MKSLLLITITVAACATPPAPPTNAGSAVAAPASPAEILILGKRFVVDDRGLLSRCVDAECADRERWTFGGGTVASGDNSGFTLTTRVDGELVASGDEPTEMRIVGGRLISATAGTIAAIEDGRIVFSLAMCPPEYCSSSRLPASARIPALYAIALVGLVGEIVQCSTGACGSQHVFLHIDH